jgi:hypothetical protein
MKAAIATTMWAPFQHRNCMSGIQTLPGIRISPGTLGLFANGMQLSAPSTVAQ